MFKQLRNNMLILNMVLISALLAASFCGIYLMNRNSVYRNIDQMLSHAISSEHFMRKREINELPKMPQRKPPEVQNENGGDRENRFDPVISYYMSEAGEINETRSPFNIESGNFDDVAELIFAKKEMTGSVRYDGTKWIYKKMPSNDGGFYISFGTFSAENKMLFNLIMTLVAIGIMALAISLFVSYVIAQRCIKPIEESYNKQKQFVADASHELKTPLTTINTNIDVLLSHSKNTIEEEQKWVTYIKDEAERMTKLTNDLLYLAKLDHDSDIVFSPVSFSGAVESVLLAMEATAFEQGVEIDSDIAQDVSVMGFEDRLRQITVILIDNAIKYSQKRSRIEVKLTSDGVLKVKNYGCGISDKDKKHIFERFYRADESRSRESGGYGLGLAIAKASVISMNGSIGVSSDGSSYTEFEVKIPKKQK